MAEKYIENMGKIKFGRFYNKNNKKITDENTSPIVNCKLLKVANEKEISSKISNDYVYSLFKKRKDYYIYECNPELLISHYRYDVYVKYFYVKNYIEGTNYDLAKEIYLAHIKAFNNFAEPDGSKKGKEKFIHEFNKLIESIKNNGFSKTIVPISTTGIIIDGAHRLAICLYLKIKIKYVAFDILDGKYDMLFFKDRGFDEKYISVINNETEKMRWL